MIEGLIAAISPKAAAQRASWRKAREEIEGLGTQKRGYKAAQRGRLSRGWVDTYGDADREILNDLSTLRARCRELVRDNPYASSALRQLTCNLVGDGIEARAVHPDVNVQKLAQEAWLSWAGSRVDGREDFYGVQKLAVRTMIEGGETLVEWLDGDASLALHEGDMLDHTLLSRETNSDAFINGGVEYDRAGRRVAYHLLKEHPGSASPTFRREHRRVAAEDVDHLFEAVRIRQSRGVPWFAAAAIRLREVQELEDAIRTKKRVEACLAVIRTPMVDGETNRPLGESETATQPTATSPALETLRPGMIVTAGVGETITTVNPSSSGDADAFYRAQLMAVSASLALPYHLLTGDVSQANYSSLRAATVAFWAALDDWSWNTIIPQLCAPAFARVMRRAAVREPRLLEVKASWTLPPRAWVDPVKDVRAEIMEIRAGLSSMPDALSSRGIEWRTHLSELRAFNDEIDRNGLALDTDARRINGAGAVQPPAGFLRPTDEAED